MINSFMPSIEVAWPCQWVVTYLWYLLKVNVSYWEGSLKRLHDYKRILVSLAVSVKTHKTVFHIFTDRFARCTCQLLLCEHCRWFLNSTFHYQIYFVYLTDCYRTLHPFIYRQKATHLLSIMSVPHDVSEYLNVFFFLVNFHNIYGKFMY